MEIHSPSGEKIESKAAATAGEKEAEKNSSSKSSSGVPKGSSVEALPPDGAPQPPASPSKVPGSCLFQWRPLYRALGLLA